MEEEAFGRQSVGQGGESHSTSRLKASSSEEQSFRLRLPRSWWRVCTHFFFFFFLFLRKKPLSIRKRKREILRKNSIEEEDLRENFFAEREEERKPEVGL